MIIVCAFSLTVFVVIVFVIGYMFGCASYRQFLLFKSSRRTSRDQTMATYSEVELAVFGTRDTQQQQNPEMMGNVAYGPLHVH